MTDEQTIKYLKELLEVMLNDGDLQRASTVSHAIDLIKRQQAEIDDLKRDSIPRLQDSLNRANKYGIAVDVENELLKSNIERLEREKLTIFVNTKVAAYKEFAERLKNKIRDMRFLTEAEFQCEEINNLVKELTEGSK
jgi:hypothetical protein